MKGNVSQKLYTVVLTKTVVSTHTKELLATSAEDLMTKVKEGNVDCYQDRVMSTNVDIQIDEVAPATT